VKLAHELGPFAAGRIDLERLAPVIGVNETLGEEKRGQIQSAFEALMDLKKAGDELFTAGRVSTGHRLFRSRKGRDRVWSCPLGGVGPS